MFLSDQEVQILYVLRDGGPLCQVEIAEILDLAPFHVRSSLQAMRRFQLVQRGKTFKTVGQHWITAAGRSELAKRQQLRLA